MLLELYIKNFALIDEMRIEYDAGLNIITGETGSGKSIMIDALSLALGKKGSKSVVRTGQKKAIVEAVFFVDDLEIEHFLNELGIDFEDKQLTITREISTDGRTVSRINGRTVTQSDLKLITTQLITIHGQNEYEQLLTSSNQLRLIDNFGENDIQSELERYASDYQKLLFIQQELLDLNDNMDSAKIQRELDLLSYEIEEIQTSNLKEGEKEEIKERLLRLENSERIQESIDFVYQNMYEDRNSILSMLSKCGNKLEILSEYLPQSRQWLETINDAYYSLEDVAHNLRSNAPEEEANESIDVLNMRLDTINQLFRKYGKTYGEVMEYLKDAVEKKNRILSRDELNKKYEQQQKELLLELNKRAENISSLRKKIANTLKKEIQKELISLNMKNVQLEIDFQNKEISRNGKDRIEFLVSFNKGEPTKPLSQIASGGEISRFMLAFKSVVAKSDNIHSLIFDEIDTGVSGIAAQRIGIKLKEISKFRQVICITHLAHIASYADIHFVVEKLQSRQNTKTEIRKLGFEQRIHEVAKMMSGSDITESSLQTAKDLILKNAENLENL